MRCSESSNFLEGFASRRDRRRAWSHRLAWHFRFAEIGVYLPRIPSISDRNGSLLAAAKLSDADSKGCTAVQSLLADCGRGGSVHRVQSEFTVDG